jgi:putative transposase
MPRSKLRPTLEEVKALLSADRDFLRPLVQAVVQELLEAEMTEALGAEKGERTPLRLGHRSGYYDRTLVTRVGKLELRVPQDRHGRFSTELFERYQRSEKALVAALAEMYVQGVSTRKVKAITEELCGHSFSASAISEINVRLDQGLAQFAGRRLEEACPYLILAARYERVREAGVIRSQAVLLAIGIGWDGRRSILAVELANRESRSSWRDFLLQLRERGLSGVEFVVSDDHAGLRRSSRSCRRRPGSAVTCTSCAMRSTTCRARSTTTACASCAGSTTGAISARPGVTSRPGSPSGRAPTPSCAAGSRSTSRRR